ncbi:hypothetical protein T440DRAFT_271773 [Plenodomus tracheiphilus IPT5]|uniref:Uncharacterized protein n=1 Tax=Plenodomus tracheiphilus IPT5 TaxID=1408161 RepID=A0A6A7BIP2_9PLEO|nr:hypothetical protein T440DRAFT_271773 [Plenodomus tracheiphilus IPT5]
MPINWQDKEVADRLLAAIIGSFDNKINCTEVARLYGKDATYNAIENFLRKPKRVATQLKAEANAEKGTVASPAKRASPTKKSGGGVKTGRVEKKAPTTPRKEVKVEEVEESVEYEEAVDGVEGDINEFI